MQFHIQPTSSRPVYLQIMDQAKRDIALGLLREGDRLPTVRETAATLAINPNTIAKAYRQMEQEGIIVTRSGAGAFVAPLESGLNKTVKKRILTEQMQRTVVDAFHMDVDQETLGQWFSELLKKFNLKS
jgi:GntR family transcriptional regulator